jgi:hypothetical protein
MAVVTVCLVARVGADGPPVYFPELAAVEPAKWAITAEDLLTMRPGLEGTSGCNYGVWASSGHRRQLIVLVTPIVEPPAASRTALRERGDHVRTHARRGYVRVPRS